MKRKQLYLKVILKKNVYTSYVNLIIYLIYEIWKDKNQMKHLQESYVLYEKEIVVLKIIL